MPGGFFSGAEQDERQSRKTTKGMTAKSKFNMFRSLHPSKMYERALQYRWL
jgi:hypothetical protein